MSRRTRTRQAAGVLAACVACALVFASYLRPALMVELGNRLWACF